MNAGLSRKQRKLVRAFGAVSQPLGKWYAHLPLALATGYALGRQGRPAAAAAVAGASVGAIVLSRAVERILPQRPPPPERREPWEQSYPSGHSFETTAVALAGGYVLVREGVWRPWTAMPLALVAAASGLGKFVMNRHWASDLVGGYCAGVALGSACAGAYELARD
jgi:undecaprenyl-diphosphatase